MIEVVASLYAACWLSSVFWPELGYAEAGLEWREASMDGWGMGCGCFGVVRVG